MRVGSLLLSAAILFVARESRATCNGPNQALFDSVVFLQGENAAGQPEGHGTGVVVEVTDTDRITVLTALHVVQYARHINVVPSACLPQATRRRFETQQGTVPLRIDAERDLALFEVRLGPAAGGTVVPRVQKYVGASPKATTDVSFVTAAGLDERFITTTNIGAIVDSTAKLFLVGMTCPGSLRGQAAACDQAPFQGPTKFDVFLLPASVSRGYSGSPVYYKDKVLGVVDQLAYGPKVLAVSLDNFSLSAQQPPPVDFNISPRIYREYALAAGGSPTWATAAIAAEPGCTGVTELGYAVDQLRTASQSIAANGLAATPLDPTSSADIAAREKRVRDLSTALPSKCRGPSAVVDLLVRTLINALDLQRELGSMRTIWSFVRDSFIQPGAFNKNWGRLTFGRKVYVVSPLENLLGRQNPKLLTMKISATKACDVIGAFGKTAALRGSPLCSDPDVDAKWSQISAGLPDVFWPELVDKPEVQATVQSRIAASDLVDASKLLAWAASADVSVLAQRASLLTDPSKRVNEVVADLAHDQVRNAPQPSANAARLRSIMLKTAFNGLPASFRNPGSGLDAMLRAFANEDVLRIAHVAANKHQSSSDVDDQLLTVTTQAEDVADGVVVALFDVLRAAAGGP